MKIAGVCFLILAVVCIGMPAVADSGTGKSGPKKVEQIESNADIVSDDSQEKGLDEKMGYGTSDKLPAQGPVGYNDNTGMANVVPSDSEGDIED